MKTMLIVATLLATSGFQYTGHMIASENPKEQSKALASTDVTASPPPNSEFKSFVVHITTESKVFLTLSWKDKGQNQSAGIWMSIEQAKDLAEKLNWAVESSSEKEP